MAENIFTWLSGMLNGNILFALAAAFIWGILSIILSPCHLASIPLIVGFIDEQGRISTKRAFYISFLFGFGILLTITIIGVITGLLGRILGDIGRWGNYLVGIILILVGIHLFGLLPLPFSGSQGKQSLKNKGPFAAFMLGLIFGIALGPCAFAYMAPMLGIAFSVAATNLLYAMALILAYAVGHVSVIIFAGTFTEVIQHYLNWDEKSKGTEIIKKICGVLVFLGGVYIIFAL
ncbi:MAG: cytochrome C biogenesis protein [Elusimicrobia bacterium]|nr:cytochrome C biogenesis protein [Elusimicrobiota bacterium]